MTRTRYTFAAFSQHFGWGRKTKRLTDAAFEMHLMQDGEEILGAYCWKNIEPIEELSMEYWNLRRLERESQAIRDKVREAEETLAEAQSQRTGVLDCSKDVGQDLLKERECIFEQIEDRNHTRDTLMASAIQTKRKHSALKMKASVLKEEGGNSEEIAKCREDLAKLRETFLSEKERLSAIEEDISKLAKKLETIQVQIDATLKGTKGEAVEAFSKISQANRDITKHKADLGLILSEQSLLYREVGRFLNINSSRRDCREACREHRGVQEQTRLLHQSIQLNRKLVDRMGG